MDSTLKVLRGAYRQGDKATIGLLASVMLPAMILFQRAFSAP